MKNNKQLINNKKNIANFNIALIGGIDRLKIHYIKEAGKYKINLKVYTVSEVDISAKIKNLDAVVIFTNKISHRFKMEVMGAVKSRKIPVYMSHSCGICSLRVCMNCILSCKD